MPETEVNLVDLSGKAIRAQLPDDRPIGQLAAAIRRKLNLADGGHLKLEHRVSGRELDPERTLAQEGVRHGDTLRLRMEAVAGGPARQPGAEGEQDGERTHQTPSIAG